jgi:hypothetical protein
MKTEKIGSKPNQQINITAGEARSIAKEAYVYGFSLVDSYRIQYSYFVDQNNPEYKAAWNEISNNPGVYTPDDKARVQLASCSLWTIFLCIASVLA